MITRLAVAGFLSAALIVSAGSPAYADEAGTARRMEKIKNSPTELSNFLSKMPKGADLHMHLSGAVYAESMISWGAAAGGCVDTATLMSAAGPCVAGQVPLSNALTDSRLYDRIMAAWSMRGFTPGAQSGHDHFFATFDLFSGAYGSNNAQALAEVSNRAGSQNEQYIEPLRTPSFGSNRTVAEQVGYSSDFAEMRTQMINAGLFDSLPAVTATTAQTFSDAQQILRCGTGSAQPGCKVTRRFDVQVLRNQPPEVVFAQLLFGFELTKRDRNWAGINMVQPEDGLYSLRDYSTHMQMIRYLRSLYPKAKVTLHAGELVAGLVPPQDLEFHVRDAVRVAGAQRIGHGVSILQERGWRKTMRIMARKKVCVEIPLSSNAQILGVSGASHPARQYLKAGVPITLATDDEGVSRTDLTSQYAQAVTSQSFSYRQLKDVARNGLRCSFLPKKEKKRLLRAQARKFKAFERAQDPAPRRTATK